MIYWIRQFFSRPNAHLSSLAEVVITAIFALLPLVIAAIKFNADRPNTTFAVGEVAKQAIGGGQLFLYSYALIGTILWLAFFKWDRVVTGPRRVLGFVTLIAAFAIISLIAIDPTVSTIKNAPIVAASYWTYAGFLGINYLLLFYMNIDPPTPDDSLEAGTNRLIKMYKKKRTSE